MKTLIVLTIISLIIYLFLRWLLSHFGPPIVIGVPDPDHKRMFWMSKPSKSRWDLLMEWGPKAAIAALMSFILGLAVGLSF